MNLHLTTGTISYMIDLKKNNEGLNIAAIGKDALLYYESEEKESMFSSRHSYNLSHSTSELDEHSPVSIHFIPVPGDSKGPVHGHLSRLSEVLDNTRGVQFYRIGEALGEDEFIVMIGWAQSSTYYDFKDTDGYSDFLSTDALAKFRTEESLFHKSISSKFYLPLKDNEEDGEDDF
ncbi:hypothetical protein GCM10022378_11050 [Salinicoccus jeotgali]|uniref:Signal transduction protein TRAP n=1 Tax=Salinicoccus jeotgali TaxID=381634 RepID=A0ABP7EQP1_9STAP